jgi:methylmalonyl-CoA mutase cobalamin-binding subunit
MAADLFTLAGFDVIFIGANAPSGVIASAVEHLRPDVLSISVSNYFHIPTAARELKEIRARVAKMPLVVVGGAAFEHNPEAGPAMGADRVLSTFEDIRALAKEG